MSVPSVVALAAAGPWGFAPVADRASGEIGVVALRAGPVVEGSLVVSMPVVPATLTALVKASVATSIASETLPVSSTLTSIIAPTVSVSTVITLFSGLFLGSDRHGHTDEGVHVEGSVNMSNVGQRPVGASDDPVHFTDVRPVVRSHHDGVEGRRGTVKMHEETAFVAF
ncbi:MAG: hypothetical protein VX422_04610 [Candidatus Thermoplasmatota archaeon]|nr:hypothetical protein [Candidatus Thermoplasmatota archaeon]